MTSEGWTQEKIGSLGQVQAGRQRAPHFTEGTARPYLRVANVFDGFINTSDVFEMNFTDAEYSTYKLEIGDILLNEGQSLELVGRPAMYLGDPPECCFQNTLVRFRPNAKIEGDFALQLFRYLMYSGQFASIATQTTSVAHLGVSRFANLRVPLPPLAEQRKIAAILGTWDKAIAAAERLVAALRERKRGLMQRLLTERVRFPEFAGRAWQERELRECVEPVSRIAKVQPGQHYNLIGVRWYLEGAHIHDTVSGDNVVTQALSRIHENDILYNKMWVTKAAFAIAKAEHHGAYGTSEYPTFTAKSNLDVRYLEYAFHDPRFLHEARALCRGTTGRARLNPDDFLKLKLLLPDREEQTKIANVLETAQQESDHAQRHVIALKEQKRGLMQRLLTGQVRVRVDEEQPA